MVDPSQCASARLAEFFKQDDCVIRDDWRLKVESSHDKLSVMLPNLSMEEI